MRKRQTFLLTVIEKETEDTSFCGKVKVISSGKTCTFTSLEELDHIIAAEMGDEMVQTISPQAFCKGTAEEHITPA